MYADIDDINIYALRCNGIIVKYENKIQLRVKKVYNDNNKRCLYAPVWGVTRWCAAITLAQRVVTAMSMMEIIIFSLSCQSVIILFYHQILASQCTAGPLKCLK